MSAPNCIDSFHNGNYNQLKGKLETNMQQEKILSLLRSNYDLGPVTLTFLRAGGGKTYIVEGNHQKYLLKIIGTAFANTVQHSISVMQYLAQNAFPVPKPILTSAGSPLLKLPVDGQDYLLSLYEYIVGKEPDLKSQAERIGELAGQLHTLLQAYPEPLLTHNYQFFIGRYLDLLRQKGYARVDDYAALGKSLWQNVEGLPMGICHGDLHRGNLLETADRQLYILDFDTVCQAPLMFDIMTMCDMTDYFHLEPSDLKLTQNIYTQFQKGYAKYRTLSKTEQQSFYAWVAIRHFQLQATIVEIHGIDCIDEKFIDMQLQWLEQWIHATTLQ